MKKIGLLDPGSHIKLLDKYGGHSDLLLEIKKKYDNFMQLSKNFSRSKRTN